jgi:hypothetical protein
MGRGRARRSVRLRTIVRGDLTDEVLDELYRLANRLMVEEADHFRVHAMANDLVHVFECAKSGEVVGFQFWKTVPLDRPRARAIVGGKLRVLPEFRGQATHLVSGLRFFLRNRLRHPVTRYYRLSMASIFGFVSLTEALAEYRLFDPHADDPEGRMLAAAFARIAREDDFRLRDDGLFDVGIFISPETLAAYSESYFERPAALRYAEANPAFRSNGCYVGFWFRFTPGNVLRMIRAIARKRLPLRRA